MYIKKYLLEITRDNNYKNFNDKKFLKLNKNEYPGEFETNFINNIKRKINSDIFSKYPNLFKLYESLAKFLNISSQNILITSGSDLAIKAVFEVYVNSKDKILMHYPGYAMSNVYGDLFGSSKKVIKINNFNENLTKTFIKKLNKNYKLIIIENPNGFTGQPIDLKDLEILLKIAHTNQIIVLIDEAYYEFNDNQSMIGFINKYKNLIISRSFSKGLSLAGIRMGYLISSKERIKELEKFKPLHEISSLTNIVALEAIKNSKKLIRIQNKIIYNKIFFIKNIKKYFETQDTKTNFILLKIPKEISQLKLIKHYRDNFILVRDPFISGLLKNYIRVTVGTKEHINKFMNVTERFFIDKK